MLQIILNFNLSNIYCRIHNIPGIKGHMRYRKPEVMAAFGKVIVYQLLLAPPPPDRPPPQLPPLEELPPLNELPLLLEELRVSWEMV